MAESIFTIIQGLSSEDLTTELLSICLDPIKGNKTERFIFFNTILKGIPIELDSYKISTQEIYEEGRPDLQIEDRNNILLLENKLTADFTDKQIYKYKQILETRYKHKEKFLVFLSPNKNQNEYLRKIEQQLNFTGLKANDFVKIDAINFISITWDSICYYLESNDYFTQNLIHYMQENHLTSIKIEEYEMELMNSNYIPDLLNKIWIVIGSNRQFLAERNYNVSRMSQSKTQYLFYVEFDWGNICIQIYLDFWQQFNTPFTLQLNTEIEDKNNEIEKIGFVANEQYGYLYPISITSKDIEKEFNNKVLEVIEKINKELGNT